MSILSQDPVENKNQESTVIAMFDSTYQPPQHFLMSSACPARSGY